MIHTLYKLVRKSLPQNGNSSPCWMPRLLQPWGQRVLKAAHGTFLKKEKEKKWYSTVVDVNVELGKFCQKLKKMFNQSGPRERCSSDLTVEGPCGSPFMLNMDEKKIPALIHVACIC